MFERKSHRFFAWLGVNLVLLGFMGVHAAYRRNADTPMLRGKAQMVRRLALTDLCLFTDARYARNPVLADLNTPFQDCPLSLEHFPSGSLLPVPPHLGAHPAR